MDEPKEPEVLRVGNAAMPLPPQFESPHRFACVQKASLEEERLCWTRL
jgi:hypothetical protein